MGLQPVVADHCWYRGRESYRSPPKLRLQSYMSYMDTRLARMPLLRTDFIAFLRELEAFLLEPDLGSRVLEDLLDGHRPQAHRDVHAYVHGVDHYILDFVVGFYHQDKKKLYYYNLGYIMLQEIMKY